MARLILFSGGAESVAMTFALAGVGDDLLYVHHPGLRLFSHPATSAAKALGRPLIEVTADPSFNSAPHQFAWLLDAADKQLRVKDYEAVWYGLYAGELDDPKKAAMYSEAVRWFSDRNPTTPVGWPLFHLTKAQQIKLLPPEVLASVSSCVSAANCQHCPKCIELEAAINEAKATA